MKKAAVIAIGFLVAVIAIIAFQTRVDTSKAVAFRTVKTDDVSFFGRNRWSQHIVAPDAATIDQLVHTVRKAALTLLEEKNSDVVTIFLEPSEERQGLAEWHARAVFIPDGKGYSGKDDSDVWKIDVMEPPFERTKSTFTYEKRSY